MGRFRDYASRRFAEEYNLQDVVGMILNALGLNPNEKSNFDMLLKNAKEKDQLMSALFSNPGLKGMIDNNAAAQTALQTDANLTVGQLAGILARGG